MKSIKQRIYENYSLSNCLVDITRLKNNQVIYVGKLDIDDNDPRWDVDAFPCKVKVSKKGQGIRFINYDDERDIFDIYHCINSSSTRKNKKGRYTTTKIAAFDNEEQAEKMCKYYNRHISVDNAFRIDNYNDGIIGDEYFSTDI